MSDPTPLLAIENLVVDYRSSGGRHRAVDDVSFEIHEGETVGLVGESGSGKTTIGRAILGLQPPTSGRIWFRGQELTAMSARQRRALGPQLRAVFQDPYSSLNPVRRVSSALLEGVPQNEDARARMTQLLTDVGLSADAAERYPAGFSGGQRQRVAIARALMSEPVLVVCDEPVTALDVSIQAQVINVLREVQQRSGVAYLFIGHDLDVVRYMSDRVVVLYRGKVVEVGDAESVVRHPEHDYTKALVAAMLDPAVKRAPLDGGAAGSRPVDAAIHES